jgi:hypothetical protein
LGSEGLPIIIEKIPAGDLATIYVRTHRTENFKYAGGDVASIRAEWILPV